MTAMPQRTALSHAFGALAASPLATWIESKFGLAPDAVPAFAEELARMGGDEPAP